VWWWKSTTDDIWSKITITIKGKDIVIGWSEMNSSLKRNWILANIGIDTTIAYTVE
jgi:hypothetical protein